MALINEALNEKSIDLNNIDFLTRNPRFGRIDNQQDILNFFLTDKEENYGKQVYNLAKDIATKGLNPTKIPTVIQTSENKYIVYEGNRRIAALKALSDPELIKDESIKKDYIELSKIDNFKNIQIRCYVAIDEKNAYDIMNKEHGGKLEGIGISSWNPLENLRFKSLIEDKSSLLVVINDYIITRNLYEGDFPKDIPISVLNRILPELKARLNLTVLGKELVTTLKEKVLNEKLSQILIALKNEDTRSLNSNTQIENFFRRLEGENQLPKPKDFNKVPKAYDVETPPQQSEKPIINVPQPKTQIPMPKIKEQPHSLERKTIFPSDFKLKIPTSRINDIYLEMKELSENNYKESLAIMTRIFLELSVDYYGDNNIPNFKTDREVTNNKFKLRARTICVLNHLETTGKITKNQANAVKTTLDAPTSPVKIEALNQYVHNRVMFADIISLKTFWDNARYLLESIWN